MPVIHSFGAQSEEEEFLALEIALGETPDWKAGALAVDTMENAIQLRAVLVTMHLVWKERTTLPTRFNGVSWFHLGNSLLLLATNDWAKNLLREFAPIAEEVGFGVVAGAQRCQIITDVFRQVWDALAGQEVSEGTLNTLVELERRLVQ